MSGPDVKRAAPLSANYRESDPPLSPGRQLPEHQFIEKSSLSGRAVCRPCHRQAGLQSLLLCLKMR